jgi:hypothetical protein
LLGDFELDGTTRLLLNDNGTAAHRTGRDDVRQPERNDIAAAKLAVQGNVEQRQVSEALEI